MNGIFDKITSVNNLFAAWREFRRGKRGKYDVQCFERELENNIFELHEDLINGCYRHGSYKRFCVYDPKYRVIHKASVRDRLLHHAIVRIITPIFERSFIYDSYSCRRGKGTHAALRRLELFSRRVSHNYTQPCFALKIDVRKFFDSVDHEILLNILAQRIPCPLTNGLLAEIVNSYSQTKIALGGGSPNW